MGVLDFSAHKFLDFYAIYFLQGDIEKLAQEVEKIEARNIEMDIYNLRILKNYFRCPNETYRNVYSHTSSCLNARR